MNAIERLRSFVPALGEPGERIREDALTDLAAVDALYQAAKRVGEVNAEDGTLSNREWEMESLAANAALAAAVRRIEGTP